MRLKIGSFLKDGKGILHGKIYGLGLGVTSVLFEPQVNAKGNISFFSLIADPVLESYEIGRAWEKKKQHFSYYSVLLDSPLFAAPLTAALFPDMENTNHFNLILNREKSAQPHSLPSQNEMSIDFLS